MVQFILIRNICKCVYVMVKRSCQNVTIKTLSVTIEFYAQFFFFVIYHLILCQPRVTPSVHPYLKLVTYINIVNIMRRFREISNIYDVSV